MEINWRFLATMMLMVMTCRAVKAKWDFAHATFYKEAPGGACGYFDENSRSLYAGVYTTALSTALFDNGGKCGSCLEVKCIFSKWCLTGSRTVRVTATDFCPPNYAKPSDNGGWCNPPRKHLDLSIPAFEHIAVYEGGIVPVLYRKVKCLFKGGIRFTIRGNPYFLLVLVWNVGGDGQAVSVSIKGANTPWFPMRRNWGHNWEFTQARLQGQALSFRVLTSDGKYHTSINAAPHDWVFGNTYIGQP
ncbi:hypothetical protein SUGI_0629170 [Cryptomeria japonica]|uniref:expansin-A9-like n=1 Tax=Cryptomeria japonica TaxID=3369 RepID=UPI002414C9CF|nr:expansin-A9-like [Cryptomeria japonica]GLJ31354.1 hypothetical protein SUGI_0629170 [Cryptomeria japonica]